MNRVSSRQRLVSWDAFDASAPDGSGDSSSDEEVLSGYQTCVDDAAMMMISPSSSWTTVGGGGGDVHMDLSPFGNSEQGTVGGHKRDRAGRHGDNDKVNPNNGKDPSVQFHQGVPATLNHEEANAGAAAALNSSPGKNATTVLEFQDLVFDTHLHVFSFLDLSSLRSILATCRSFRNLLMSNESNFVWIDWIHHVCPKLQLIGEPTQGLLLQPSEIRFMDSMQLPTAAGRFEQHDVNLTLLLSLASKNYSSTIDVDSFQPPPLYNFRYPSRRQNLGANITRNGSTSPRFVMYQEQSISIVQFCGDVGIGDRCIRAKEPLARPTGRIAAATFHPCFASHNNNNGANVPESNSFFFLHGLPLMTLHDHFHHHHLYAPPAQLQRQQQQQQQEQQQQQRRRRTSTSQARSSFLDMICRGAKAHSVVDIHQHSYWHWKPFVTPHVTLNDGVRMLDLTPRLVAYFEVSILDDTTRPGDDQESEQSPRRHRNFHQARSDCVAVGVASSYFDVHSRMPGWDSFSFGYHGDDGGIFHASGVMLRPYGPCFGVGDTVGCGIDYTNSGIFFTLNSKFLGYAWTGVSTSLYLQQDLYPVVGVDTNAPISCNFGERPFAFDLSSFLRQQAASIRDACGLSNLNLELPTSSSSSAVATTPTTNSETLLQSRPSILSRRRR